MLVVNITYDAVTRLMAVDEISTGQPNRVVGTTADNNGTMLHFTFIDFDNTLEDYAKIVQFGSVLVDAEHDTYRPPMTLDENNNVVIPDYIMSHVLRNTLTIQLVFKHTDTETGDVTEFRSLNILKLRVEPAIPTGDMPDPQEVIRYGDLLNGVTYDPDTSTFTYHQMDGGEIYVHLTDLAEDHFTVPTASELDNPEYTGDAENGDTATAEDTGVWYKLYIKDGVRNWVIMPGGATQNGAPTTAPVFYAPRLSGTSGQYLESRGENNSPEWVSKITAITGNSDILPTTTAVKTYVDTNVTAERTRAVGEENRLDGKIDGEIARATQSEQTLQTNIDTEAGIRATNDTTLQSNIDAEETRAKGVEDALDDKIDTEIQNRKDDVDTEETRAKAAEAGLQADITAEATARQNADNTLTTNLASEVNTRGLEITRVEGLISAEATARDQADTALSTAISNEVTRATGAESDLQTSITALQNNKVDKTFSDSVFVGASITDRTDNGAKLTFNKKDTNNDQTGTVAVSLPIASGGANGLAGLATADQIDQIIRNREDIDLLLGKSTRYAIDINLTGMTDAQIQTALTTAWRTASGQTTGDPAQYTTLVNLWNNHEYTWFTYDDGGTTVTEWVDRGISTVSIATSNSLGVVMGTDPDPVNHTADGTVYVDANGQMQVNGWDDVTTDISNAQSDIIGLQNTKVDKTTTVNGHPLSSNITVTKGDVGLGNADNTSDADKPVSTAQQTALDGKADVDLKNITVGGTVSNGKTIVWNASDDQWEYGEAGKVDAVQINNTTIAGSPGTDTSKVANITTGAGLQSASNEISHVSSGVTAGTYQSVTVNQLGHVTDGSNIFEFRTVYLEEVD